MIVREHAPGPTPRQIIDKMNTVRMVDVVMPMTNGRVVMLPRYVESKEDVALLLGRSASRSRPSPHRRYQAAALRKKRQCSEDLGPNSKEISEFSPRTWKVLLTQ